MAGQSAGARGGYGGGGNTDKDDSEGKDANGEFHIGNPFG